MWTYLVKRFGRLAGEHDVGLTRGEPFWISRLYVVTSPRPLLAIVVVLACVLSGTPAIADAADGRSSTRRAQAKRQARRSSGGCLCGKPARLVAPAPPATDSSTKVRVELTINESGGVIAVRAMTGRADLRKRAVEELKSRTFQPATLRGVA